MECDDEDKLNRIRGLATEQRDKKPGGMGTFCCQEVLDVFDHLEGEIARLKQCLSDTTELFRRSTDESAAALSEQRAVMISMQERFNSTLQLAESEIARLKAPAHVLGEAERLLREARVWSVHFNEPDHLAPTVRNTAIVTRYRDVDSGSLATAYENLRKVL